MASILYTKSLSKVYGKNDNQISALDDVSIGFEEGSFTAITGRSGSGKSTLLHLLGGLDEPTRGAVFLENKKIYDLRDSERTILRRRRIGFVFQFYNLIPELTAYENIVLPINLDGRNPDL
jgi:putative ABC transport system ATP-binding protein